MLSFVLQCTPVPQYEGKEEMEKKYRKRKATKATSTAPSEDHPTALNGEDVQRKVRAST